MKMPGFIIKKFYHSLSCKKIIHVFFQKFKNEAHYSVKQDSFGNVLREFFKRLRDRNQG
jgi:hypothetical protein